MRKPIILSIALIASLTAAVPADGWPMWGGSPDRNMYAPNAEGLPASFKAGEPKTFGGPIDPATTENVKWIAEMGSQTYGNPTVANGRVYVGTNNDGREDDRFPGDHSLVKCLDEETGEVEWILTVPKLGAGKVSDWEYLGICSSPAIDGDRVYVVTNLSEVVCLDVKGLSNGNQGYQKEGLYMAGPPGDEDRKPVEVKKDRDADILWRYDMRQELGVFPHNITSCSPLVVGDYVYTATSNGKDWSHKNMPNPRAPALIALHKKTGELAGEETAGISKRTLHSNWSSPAYGKLNGKELLIYGGGDGRAYGFKPEPVEGPEGFPILKELWRYDVNLDKYRTTDSGEPRDYATGPLSPSEIIGTPVYHDGKVYVGIGQDPEHGPGKGNFACISADGSGDVSAGERVWQTQRVKRTISTASVADGLVYIADYSGFVHCFDAETGKHHWTHDTMSHIWGSTLVADGKVYVGNEDGVLTVLKHGKEKKVLAENDMYDPIYSTPVPANGVLYVATNTNLYAVEKQD